MRMLATCVIAFSLFVGTPAMAADKEGALPADPATPAAANSAATSASPSSAAEARMEEELQQLRDLIVTQQKQSQQQTEELKQELKEQQQKVQLLEEQMNGRGEAHAVAAAVPAAALGGSSASIGIAAPAAVVPQPQNGSTDTNAWKKIYDGGFYVASEDNKFSLHINGLFQPRFTEFDPNSSATALGAPSSNTSDFDTFLGRLALSGSVFDPSVKYFVQFQGSTSSNTIGMNFIDWFAQKQFSKALSVQMGRSWTPYSLENLDSPGQYLFADFSSAEYAFALSRAVGFEALGQIGKFGYALMIANSVPGLDAAGQENFNNKLAYIGHVQYDVLAPYGYQESDPNPAGAPTELTLWTSAAYNPVATPSAFENQSAGDRTVGVNQTVAFRKKFFTLQNTGFYRDTERSALPSFNSYGFAEQAGYYLIPGHFEVIGRVSGVNWGALDFASSTPGSETNTWYSGPNFAFHRVDEHSVGFNYYLYGHNAKLQSAYSYLTGNTFSAKGFAANRVWIQAQIMF
jgi:Phosphate-selective porin O and P